MLRNPREDHYGTTMTLHNTKGLIKVHNVDIGHAMTTKRTSEFIVHATIRIHLLRHRGTHKHLDSKQLSFFAKCVLGRVLGKETFPRHDISWVVVGLDTATSEPNRVTVGGLGITQAVTISGHDSFNGPVNVLVWGVGVSGDVGLNRECGNNTEREKKMI
jgi:hypothetical protein